MLPDRIFVRKKVAFRLIRASFICSASNRKIQENKKERILSPGDVILLEIQIGYNGGPWLPIETQSAEFEAIQYATSLGIVVVEAGANGGVDLDQYKHWDDKYIFNRDLPDFKDSGQS